MGVPRVDADRAPGPGRAGAPAAAEYLRLVEPGRPGYVVVADRRQVTETIRAVAADLELTGVTVFRVTCRADDRMFDSVRRLVATMIGDRNPDDPVFAGAGGFARDRLEAGGRISDEEREAVVYGLSWLVLAVGQETGRTAVVIDQADRCDPESRRVFEAATGGAAEHGPALFAAGIPGPDGRIERWSGFTVVPTVPTAPPVPDPEPVSPGELGQVKAELAALGSDRSKRTAFLTAVTQQLIEAGRPDDAGALAESELERCHDLSVSPDPAVLVAAVRASQLVIGRRDRAVELTGMLARLASSDGGAAREFFGEIALERVNTVAAGRGSVIEAGLQSVGSGEIPDSAFTGGLGWFFGCYALHLAERNRVVLAVLDRAVADAARRRSLPDFVRAIGLRSGPLFHLGHLREAVVDCELALAAGIGDLEVWLPAVRSTLMQIRALLMDFEGAELVAAGQKLGSEETAPTMLFRFGRGTVRRLAGNWTAAIEDFERAGRLMEDGRGNNPATMPWRAATSLALVGRGEPGDLRRAAGLAAEELRLAREFGSPGPVGTALRACAACETDHERKLALLREAVSSHRNGERVTERLEAEIALGRALAGSGRREEARELLRETLHLAHVAGADLLARRARRALVAAGGKPRRYAVAGPDSLTPSERRVVELAAQGLGNRDLAGTLFLTVKTVEWHLTRAYAKLGITRREELGDALSVPARGFRGGGGVDRILSPQGDSRE